MLSGSISKYVPTFNPDFASVLFTPSGNYTTGGDTANLNPASWTDPNTVGLLGEPLNVPQTPVSVDTQNLGGYYAEVVPASTLAAFKVQFYTSEGNELAAGAYPAAITGGQLVLRVPLR